MFRAVKAVLEGVRWCLAHPSDPLISHEISHDRSSNVPVRVLLRALVLRITASSVAGSPRVGVTHLKAFRDLPNQRLEHHTVNEFRLQVSSGCGLGGWGPDRVLLDLGPVGYDYILKVDPWSAP